MKIFKDKLTKKNFFIACTDRQVFRQEINDLKSFRLIFDAKDHFNKFVDIFEVPSFVSNKNLILLSTKENFLIELDTDKTEQHSDNTILSFLTKLNPEKKTKIIKYELNFTPTKNSQYCQSQTYFLFMSTDENKNPKTVLKFGDKYNIITCKFRPKNPNFKLNNTQYFLRNPKSKQFVDHNHLAISLGNNKLYLNHYESKCQVASFISYYGNFTCLEFSPDGRLLGAGTESDHIFIIDCEERALLYCLEGHKNYISQIRFFENVNENEEQGINLTKMDSTSTGVSNSANNNSNKRRPSMVRLPMQEISIDEMRSMILKENLNKNDYINADFVRKNRGGGQNMNIFDNCEDNKIMTAYDIFTTGMDGFVYVWRIEHYYDEYYYNEKNYSDFIAFTSQFNLCKTDNLCNLLLFPKDKNKISFTHCVKISNNPIVNLIYNENFFVFITKKVSTGSILFLKIYNGVTRIEEVIETNFLTQGNLTEDLDDMITERSKMDTNTKTNNTRPPTSKTGGIPIPKKNQSNNSQTKVDMAHSKSSTGFYETPKKNSLNTMATNEKKEMNKSPIPSWSDNKRKVTDKDKDNKKSSNSLNTANSAKK